MNRSQGWQSCDNQHPEIYYDAGKCPVCEALRYKEMWEKLAKSLDMMDEVEAEGET